MNDEISPAAPGAAKLRVGILGTRGIPARYGGFETFAEELATRLAKRGHRVVVYGRRAFGAEAEVPPEYRGVELRVTPTVMQKYLETPLHALTSFLDLFRRDLDVVLLCNAANSPFAWLVKLRGLPLAINVDGIERERSKWNSLGRLWYRLGERCSVWFADRVVADARVIADYYQRTYRCAAEVLAYGGTPTNTPPGEMLTELGLTPGRYVLYVSRLEPENNALGVIEAYRQVETDLPLVIVGDAPYADEYKRRLREAADDRVIFTGYRFGTAYRELLSNCTLYVQATEVGGTHPALVEAMAEGACIIANGTPENLEVLGGAGAYYAKNAFGELAVRLRELLNAPEQRRRMGTFARERAATHYDWERVTDGYERLLETLVSKKVTRARG